MVSKTIGYVLAGVGVIVTALGSIPKLKEAVKIIPSGVNDMYIMGIGLIVVVAGVFLLVKNPSSKQPAEVPIYEGKNVVGYRRMKK